MGHSLTFKSRLTTTAIIVHDSHSPPNLEHGEAYLRVQGRVRGLLEIGYHFIINRDGLVLNTRDHDRIGSHCTGRNRTSVGICLMGGIGTDGKPEDNFLAEQMVALRRLVRGLWSVYGPIPVLGHDEVVRFHSDHRCPAVSMNEVRLSCRQSDEPFPDLYVPRSALP